MTWRALIAGLVPDAVDSRLVLLGTGLWGSTVDLGDGTVMKLVRRAGGLGDAIELWTNETRALKALDGHPLPCTVPRLIACGTLVPGQAGYLAWIHMTLVEGTALDDDKVTALSPGARSRLAHGLGEALAALHEADVAPAFSSPRADVDRGYLDEIAPEVADVADGALIAALKASLAEMAAAPETVANHGDINTTNILADGAGRLTGLIDWAEARRDWPEAEFCHLRFLPEFLAPVRAAYEARRGLRLDDRKLDMAALHNALITVAIARRRGARDEEAWGLEWLAKLRGILTRSTSNS